MAFLDRGLIKASDSPSIDAFDRWRVSNPYTIFDSKLVIDKNEFFYDEEVNGTATSTHNSGDASVSMSVSANADYVVRQTYQRFNYQPGKSQEIILTGVIGSPVANTVSRIGYFNSATTGDFSTDYDGIWLESDGTDISVCVGKSGVIDKITQSNWNLDVMDGTGDSGINLDFDNAQIFFIDFEWLGVGRVRCGFVIDGIITYVHQFLHANIITGVYMSSPNHSVRYEIRSTGGTKTMKQICSSVMSEGGADPSGTTRGISMTSDQTVGTTFEGVLGIRLKSTHLCSTINVASISTLTLTTNDNMEGSLLLNPTITDTPSWISGGLSSPFEYAIGSGANTLSGGQSLNSYFFSDDSTLPPSPPNTILNPGVSIAGVRDEFWLGIRTISGTGNVVAAMNILELTCG